MEEEEKNEEEEEEKKKEEEDDLRELWARKRDGRQSKQEVLPPALERAVRHTSMKTVSQRLAALDRWLLTMSTDVDEYLEKMRSIELNFSYMLPCIPLC